MMRPAHTHPSTSRASPFAGFSRKRDAVHMSKVATGLPISCRPGWTPDYELVATRIPTLILPSCAIPRSVPLERSKVQSGRAHSSIPITPTIIVTPPSARFASQTTPRRSNDYLCSGSICSDSSSSESTAGLDIQIPMSVPLSRSTSNHYSSSSKRRTSSKLQSSNLKGTRSRSSRGTSDQYLQVPSPRHHRPSRLRRSAHVKPLDCGLSLDLTKVKSSFRVTERDVGRSPLWMHADECPPSLTPMLERMMLDD